MPVIGAGIGAGVGAIGSIYGANKAAKTAEAAMKQQRAFAQKAIDELQKVGIPSVEAQRIALETPELVYEYVPQMEQEWREVESNMESIETDPRLAQQQNLALTGLEERAEMGLTPEDMAELDAIRRDISGGEQSRQAGILQQMEQRGVGGSGNELAARLASSQDATQRAGEESDRIAAMSFNAKQQALQGLLSGASNVRGQEFGEEATKGSAMDAISQFNAANRSNTIQRNIDRQNAAERERQQMIQGQEDTRVGTANKEQMYNKELLQQDYRNKMDKAQGISAALTGQGQAAATAGANKAANEQQMWSGIGQAAGGIAKAGYAKYGGDSGK